jgi:hypothetical protein
MNRHGHDLPTLSASCIHCHELHEPADALAFHPVCPVCANGAQAALPPRRPHELTHATIDSLVTATSAGTFALGYLDGSDFCVFYVGRSDADLNRRLHEWVDRPSHARRHAPAAKAAWDIRPRRCFAAAPALARVGVGADTAYTRFVFRYASSAAVAFERECRDYHDLGGSELLDNEHPPVAPEGIAGAWLAL